VTDAQRRVLEQRRKPGPGGPAKPKAEKKAAGPTSPVMAKSKTKKPVVPRELTMSPDHAQWIVDGRKTQTARASYRLDVRPGMVIPITVIDRRPNALRIRVVECRRCQLGDLTEEDARAEGCASLAAYRESWERFTRQTWDSRTRIVVVRFQYVA